MSDDMKCEPYEQSDVARSRTGYKSSVTVQYFVEQKVGCRADTFKSVLSIVAQHNSPALRKSSVYLNWCRYERKASHGSFGV